MAEVVTSPVQHEVSGRTAVRSNVQINVYPVSKGTWTVRGFFTDKSKSYSARGRHQSKVIANLRDHFEVIGAIQDVQDWLDEKLG